MGIDPTGPAGHADTVDAQLESQAPASGGGESTLRPGVIVAQQYEIERLLGVGGMGAVYLARDAKLDRPVALKVHRVSTQAARLHREAIAMAKLSHPNVVVVYEVGELEGHPFVAMEYVPGDTLRAWAKGKSWREVLRAFVAAGEGLAAVHAAGLVHRDVKPDNILVGKDGRVRLGDFGLAALPSTDAMPEDTPHVSLTATGSIVGTPAYMAPEQLEGKPVDARTDQFAFCVAVWELLAGMRPFSGETLETIRTAIRSGELQSGKRRMPGVVRRALARGLAPDPAARYRGMPQLLAAFRSALRRGRVIAGAAVGSVIVAGVIAWSLWPRTDPTVACKGAGRDLVELFPSSVVTAAMEGLGSGAGGPRDIVQRAYARFGSDYMRVAADACVAEKRGQWSRELAAASRECRTYGARTARELFAAAADPSLARADAAQIATLLPDLTPCVDARFLAGWQPLASDPAQVPAIVAARARLDAAAHLSDLGHVGSLRRAEADLAQSPVASAPAIAGRLALVRALIAREDLHYDASEKQLADVYFASRAREDGELALLAVSELIRSASELRRDAEVAARWVRDGLAEADRNAVRLPGAAAEVYLTAAIAANEAGDPKKALELAHHAEELAHGHSDIEIGVLALRSDANEMLGKLDQALSDNADYLDHQRQALGEHHPALASALAQRASILIDANRAEEARPVIDEALKLVSEEQAPVLTLAGVDANLGAVLTDLQDPRAEEVLQRARDAWVKAYGEDHPDVAQVDSNLGLVANDHGDHARAVELLSHAARVLEKTLGAEHVDLAGALFNLAVAQRDDGKLDEAAATARRCAAIYAAHQPRSLRHVNSLALVAQISNVRHDLDGALAAASAAIDIDPDDNDAPTRAWPRLEAAKALIALHRDPARTRTLLHEARDLYEAASLTKRVTEIDAMLAAMRAER
jgi:tetratricopeptide (TPR) repeat protein/predicted Ser/Thr protein kinase